MKLTVCGEISVTYVETLCMIFFPGAKFSGNEDDGIEAEVTLEHRESGDFASAVIRTSKKTTSGSGNCTVTDEADEKRRAKLAVGAAVLEAGTALLGTPPPWGMLSGVRPSKIASSILASGADEEQTAVELMEKYRVSERKARLVTSVAKKESAILSSVSRESCSLYISIPFCPTRCAYCSFVSYATPRLLSLIPEYLEKLCLDIPIIKERMARDGKTLSTIYIGGGTPTVLNEKQLETLLSAVNQSFDVSSLREFTLEAGRPDTITAEKLKIAAFNGVSRVSINPQTLNDEVLHGIGRAHSAADFLEKYALARKSGIKVINTDLIAGLPGDTEGSFRNTIDRILELSPENITVHTFTVKKSAELKESGENVYSYTGGSASACVSYAQDALTAAGYAPYYLYRQKNTVGNLENTGFARDGTEGIYNILIMEEVQNIYGIGAGAVTKLVGAPGEKIVREFEPKYPYEWLDKKKSGNEETK